MSLTTDTTMQVQPVYGSGSGGFGWGGDFGSWIILFLLFGLFGGWGNGYGFGGGWGGNGGGGFNAPGTQGYATRADINEGFALNGLQNGQTSIRDAVSNGFHSVDNALCNLGYQMQDCCCQTQRAIDGVNYNMATQIAGVNNAIQGVRYDMATQACDTRNTIQTSTRDIIDNQNANARPAISLSMRLYFDEVNLADSFMWEKFTSGVSVQTGVNIATAVAGAKGKVWTVQTQVEGLVAALRNLYTRKVYFHWADFTFGGQLQTVMAQYTMFSTSGRPVRAVVSRWAMVKVVRPLASFSKEAWTIFSLSLSRALVASSRIMMGGFFKKARAMLMRCFCPPESLTPRSPTKVS